MDPQPSIDYRVLDRPDVLRCLFHPRSVPGPMDGGERYRELLIPVAPDTRIGARFHMAAAQHANLLFFHGNGEIVADYDDIAPLFNCREFNFIAVDYRGYGISEGRPTVSAMMADCHPIFAFVGDWLKANGYNGPLIVMGRSLGSASALELAAANPDGIDGLVIESGFAWAGPLLRLLGVDAKGIGFDEAHGFGNPEKIRRFTRPTVIIHAEYDHIIPFGDGEALYTASGAADKELVKIPGANHNDIFMYGLDQYLDALGRLAGKLT